MGFDTTTLLLMFLLGPVTFVLGWSYPFVVLSVLVLLLPFRDLSIRMLNAFTDIPIETVNSLSRWWFVIVLGLLAIWLIKGIRSALAIRRFPRPEAIDVLLGGVVVLGAIEAFVSPNRAAGITSLRGYLQPLAVFVLARSFLPRNEKHLRAFHIALLIDGVIMLGMALWQLFSWTEETYRAWGYIDQSGRITGLFRDLGQIGVAFIRPASTVSGPNELGSIMLILFFLALQWAIFSEKKRDRTMMVFLAVAFLIGLAITNSRSVFLGLIAATVVFVFYLFLEYRSRIRRIWRDRRILFVTYALLSLAVVWTVMKASGLWNIVHWSIQNPQAQAHITESVQALRDIAREPAGVGMGMVWPKGAAVLRETAALYHVEGALFQIAFEWGVWGLGLWMLFIALGMLKNGKAWAQHRSPIVRIHSGTAVLGWVGVLVVFLFLPLMQSINLMVMLWFILGLGVGWERNATFAE